MNLKKTLQKFKSLEGILEFRVNRILNFTDEPHFHQFSCSPKDSLDDEDELGSVALSLNENSAKIRALGEYIERYCLENPNQKLIVCSYRDIHDDAINPAKFLNFRDEDIDSRKEEYIQRLQEIPLSWVNGINVKTRSVIMIPAQLVYLSDIPEEPVIRPRISTGAATHETYENALLNGILECIERDSFMLRYLSKDSIPQVRLDGKLKELEEYFKRYKLELNLFDITTNLQIPSFMCLNVDRTGIGPAVSIGLKAGLNPREAIISSIIESQQVRQWIRYYYFLENTPKISTPSEIDSIRKRGYFWYSLDKIKELDFLFCDDMKDISKIKSPINSLEGLIEFLSSKGLDIYSVDITKQEIRKAGFYVIKTVIPQLHPLYLEERSPCLFSERLNKNLNGRDLNLVPHPFM